ncbi:hypothetical protein Mpal_1242 [Methanosphaerula palustris E1-9c]|uniref:DZANK-type domain-containing protein n=1 Tax=Methanosphaerula palustris (strain ATCC BAA-1556 / DSM 19958 / E1-9c) TaxID=521011 RepID=B8GHH2_METPE|nr:hypothetical protein Mpal_1242 [Methanosphaerula palustris E1-9c]
MKQCPGCGTSVLPGWSFCPSCNRDLRILPTADDPELPAPRTEVAPSHSGRARRCETCGHLNPEDADRCEACDKRFVSHELRLDSPVVIGIISIVMVLLFVVLSLPGGLLSGQQYTHQLPPSAGIGPLSGAGPNASLTRVTTLTTSLPLPVVSAPVVSTVLTTTLQAPVPVASGVPSIVQQPVVITSTAPSTPGSQVPVVPAGLPNASSFPVSTAGTPIGVSSLSSTPTATPSLASTSSQVVTIPVPANGHLTGQLTWAGTGNYASDFFTLSPGEVRLTATADTSSGVIAEVRDRTGTVLGRVSTGGSQQESTMLTIPENSTYLIAMIGEGGWTVAVTQATVNTLSQSADLSMTTSATMTATQGTGTSTQQGVVTPQVPPTHASLPVS